MQAAGAKALWVLGLILVSPIIVDSYPSYWASVSESLQLCHLSAACSSLSAPPAFTAARALPCMFAHYAPSRLTPPRPDHRP